MENADQAEIIAFLSTPDAHGGAAPVERIETHISVVFLVGDRAYKLKRAVRLSFLDYSSAEQRRRFCEAEVAINRRTAPTLYLGVVPVVRRGDGELALGGDGDPVDWLVAMRRFEQSALWDTLAREGAITPAMVNALADGIAAFHLAAEVDRGARGSAAMAETVGQVVGELGRHAGTALDRESVDRFETDARVRAGAVADLLDRRAAAGAVRRCHGDLHLRNIVQIDGAPQLFDAIEFNDALSVIDVLYDLAFLVMDLEHRELRPLANLLTGRYLALTGDHRGLAALPLFIALRAAIRAYVGASAAAYGADRAARRDEARAYLDLACQTLVTPAPRLVAVGGLSGSGKSTQARLLAPAIGVVPGAVHLQSDAIRKRLAGVDPETRLGPEHYTPEISRRVYRRLRRDARRVLAAGYSVVADATFLDPAERRAIEATAGAARVPFSGLWLDAPAATMEQRIAARRGDASDAVVEVLRGQLEAGPVKTDWTPVEAASGADATARAIARSLGLGGPAASPACRPGDPR